MAFQLDNGAEAAETRTIGGPLTFDTTGDATFTAALETPDVASGGMLAVHDTDVLTHSIRIRSADGTLYYLMATTTVTNRTGGA